MFIESDQRDILQIPRIFAVILVSGSADIAVNEYSAFSPKNMTRDEFLRSSPDNSHFAPEIRLSKNYFRYQKYFLG